MAAPEWWEQYSSQIANTSSTKFAGREFILGERLCCGAPHFPQEFCHSWVNIAVDDPIQPQAEPSFYRLGNFGSDRSTPLFKGIVDIPRNTDFSAKVGLDLIAEGQAGLP